MFNTLSIEPLGFLLQKADLVSTSQIELALQDQIKSHNLKIGEILARRGWIKQQTADFFAEQWNSLLSQKSKQPLGYYLKEAALLTENQIKTILSQQKQKKVLGLRFGALVVLNGWLKSTTVEFFLNYFYPERPSNLRQNYSLHGWSADKLSNPLEAIRENLLTNEQCDSILLLRLYQQILLQGRVTCNGSNEQKELLRLGLVIENENQLKVANNIYQAVFNPCWVDQELRYLDRYSKIKLQLLKLDEKSRLPYLLLTEILSWTGNQPFLIQKLIQILHESESFIPAGEEAKRIEQLVQTRMIANWETQAAANHLKEIRAHFVHNQQCKFPHLAKLYQKILRGVDISAQDSAEETELINLGLVVKEEGKLKVANRIYQKVFNLSWLETELAKVTQPSPLATTTTIKPTSVVAQEPLLPPPTRISSETNNLAIETKAKWLIGAIILFAASLLGLKLFSQSREANIFRQGNELLVRGIHQEAITKYNQLLKINGNYYQAWTNRGYAFAGLKEYQKMLDSCTSATIIETEAVYAWNCQGEALYNLKQYDEAMAAFDKAIALEPKNALFWINKAESLLTLKKNDQALRVIDQAIRLLDSDKKIKEEEKIRYLSVAFSHKGKALGQNQEYKRALKAYDQALNYVPDYFTAQQRRGITLQKLKRSDEALTNFNQILNNPKLTDNQKAEIWYYLGLTLIDLSRDQEAISSFDQALKFKPDYQAAAQAKKGL